MPPITRHGARSYVSSHQVKRGTDRDDIAAVYKADVKPPRKESSYAKFKAVAGNAEGTVQINRFCCLRQGTIDQWQATGGDDNGRLIEFFTPRKFKDAEAICFNAKTASAAGYLTTTALQNGITMRDVYVKYAAVNFSFVNASQYNTKVEMYICYGKEGEGSTTPWDDWNNTADMSAGNLAGVTYNTIGYDLLANEEWLRMWDVQKISMNMEPGERASYQLKGPSMYVLEPQNHTALGTTPAQATPIYWQQPSDSKGNGCRVFFRMLNQMALCANNDAGTAANINMGNRKIGAHHPPNTIPASNGLQQSGVMVRMSEYFIIKAPIGLDNQVQSKNIINDFHTLAGDVTAVVAVDTDQAMTVPAAFL